MYLARNRAASETREGLAGYSAKGVPSFLSYFKSPNIDAALGFKPATSRTAFKRSTDRANTAAVQNTITVSLLIQNISNLKKCFQTKSLRVSAVKVPPYLTFLHTWR